MTLLKKQHFFKGRRGTYVDLYLHPTPTDHYGNDYRVTQDLPKAAREAGVRGEIVGNGKAIIPKGGDQRAGGASRAARRPSAPPPDQKPDEDDIPF